MTAAELIAKYREAPVRFFRGTAKPYVRWWWLAGPFTREDIARQLRWVREMGFGGVELAWIYPSWIEEGDEPRPEWLGAEWTELVLFAKRSAEELGLGCDFTFGSCWPFGGSRVTRFSAEDAAQTFTGSSEQRLGCSWEEGPQPVLNHLSATALERYAMPLLEALRPALDERTGLFCDSLELRTEGMWSRELWGEFERRFGYSLRPFAEQLDTRPEIRYDYRKLIAETIRREFYEAFTEVCRRAGGYARVQCHGAPADLLAVYAAADVPESEALLFAPEFSRIAASAAAWAGKPIVSAEAFTCLYGFPGWDDSAETYWRKETTADLKLLADSLFAHGVNQVVWHGMAYQPAGRAVEFYASVHVGPESVFAAELPAFNRYLEEVSGLMRLGRAYGGLGVYLPFEDALMEDRLHDEERTPGANYRWEMRHATPPAEVEGFHPLWISQAFLREAHVEGGRVCSRELALDGLYVDCEWLDTEALTEFLRLARQGARIVWKQRCKQPGYRMVEFYDRDLEDLLRQPNVIAGLSGLTPLVSGGELPTYWGRLVGEELMLFFAHPQALQIGYPMDYGLGLSAEETEREIVLQWRGGKVRSNLRFPPCGSVIVMLDRQGSAWQVETSRFRPAAQHPLNSAAEQSVVDNQDKDGTDDSD